MKEKRKVEYNPTYFTLCTGVGLVFGFTIFNNMYYGIIGGACLGLLVSIMDYGYRIKKMQDDNEEDKI